MAFKFININGKKRYLEVFPESIKFSNTEKFKAIRQWVKTDGESTIFFESNPGLLNFTEFSVGFL